MATSEEVNKKLTEDSCQECDSIDKRNLFLEKKFPHLADPNESTAPSLLRQTLEQYQQSQLKYKHLIEFAPDAIIATDTETGNILEANSRAAEMLGIPIDQIIGMHFLKLHPAEDREKYIQLFQKACRMEPPFILEDIEVCSSNGKKIPVHISASLVQIGDKKVISGFFMDITEQKQKEQQLKASQMQFKRLSEATFEGIVIHDNGVFVEANQQFADMFGYSLEELKELNGLDLFTPESREIAGEKIASGDPGPYEATCLRKDGSIFPVEIRARPIQLKRKQLRIAVCRDLTEQKKLQHDLIESEQKYRELYKNARACLFRNRISDGKIIACSRAGAALFGYADVEEFMARCSATDFYVDPQRREQLLEALRKDKQVEDFQVQVKHRDGTPFWVSVTAEIFPEQDYLEGVMVDITATKVLTKTEKKILDHLMQGKSNKEIAFETGRSRRTVEDHRASIMKKLGVDNIVDLTRIALKSGISASSK